MKKLILFCLIAIFSHANAEFISGMQLHNWMKSEDEKEKIMAASYILGVADAAKDISYCPFREQISFETVIFMTRKMIEIHADKLEKVSADQFVILGLSQVYPCKKEKKT